MADYARNKKAYFNKSPESNQYSKKRNLNSIIGINTKEYSSDKKNNF